jgi:hypothetical protein
MQEQQGNGGIFTRCRRISQNLMVTISQARWIADNVDGESLGYAFKSKGPAVPCPGGVP